MELLPSDAPIGQNLVREVDQNDLPVSPFLDGKHMLAPWIFLRANILQNMFINKVTYLGPSPQIESWPGAAIASTTEKQHKPVKKTREGQILSSTLRKEMGEVGQNRLNRGALRGVNAKSAQDFEENFTSAVQTFKKKTDMQMTYTPGRFENSTNLPPQKPSTKVVAGGWWDAYYIRGEGSHTKYLNKKSLGTSVGRRKIGRRWRRVLGMRDRAWFLKDTNVPSRFIKKSPLATKSPAPFQNLSVVPKKFNLVKTHKKKGLGRYGLMLWSEKIYGH